MTTGSGRAAGLVPAEGGILVVDKPVGPTSHDVVSRVRRALSDRRVGHTGTLDPLASGVLVLCIGPATRLSQFLVGADKRYTATVRLGVETDSLDADGEVVRQDEAWREVTDDQIRESLRGMIGPSDQVPPAFSAKKVDGERAHRLARRGEEVSLQPVPVVIHDVGVTRVERPELDLEMEVSSGTFVRAVARDLAYALGTCGHVTALRRTWAGGFDVADAVGLSAIEKAPEEVPWITPLDAVSHLPTVHLEASEAHRLTLGQRLASEEPEGMVRVEFGGGLLAIAEVARGALRPRKVFMTPEAVAR